MACAQEQVAVPVAFDVVVDPRTTAEDELRFGTIRFVDGDEVVFKGHKSRRQAKIERQETCLWGEVFEFVGHIMFDIFD